MDLINEKNQIEAVNLPAECCDTLYAIVRVNCFPLRDKIKFPHSFQDLPVRLSRMTLADNKKMIIYSTHVPFKENDDFWVEFVIHMNEQFEVLMYSVYFVKHHDEE